METSNPPKIWLHRLVLPGKHGRLGTFLLIALSFAFVFLLAGLELDPRKDGFALFFCFFVAYMIPASHFITEQTVHALNNLELHLPDGPGIKSEQFYLRSARIQIVIGLFGILGAIFHEYVILNLEPGGILKALANMSATGYIFLLMNFTIWIVVTTVVAQLARGAHLFNQLAKKVSINLLDTTPLAEFSRVAVYSTLILIGGQAAMAMLFVNPSMTFVTLLPGFLGMFLPMLYVLLLPIMPLHSRLKLAKSAKIQQIQLALNQSVPTAKTSELDTAQTLAPLLSFRREILLISEWPFNTPILLRLLVYLGIPPLTWVGAALIERLVDQL